MEKENLDNFLENRQSYMMDSNMQQLNVAGAGDGVVGGVQAEVVSGVAGDILGGKYDEHHEEHDVGDDDELKYVEEVQQSEKQQQQQHQALKNIGLDDDVTYKSNELAEKETNYNVTNELGNGNGGFLFGEAIQNRKQQERHDLFKLGNGHDTNGHDVANINEDFGNSIPTGFENKLSMMESDLDGFKNDGDFSSTSNVTESADGFVPQVDVEIETKIEHHEMIDEEEPSSLATNTTNGTSSLSENVPPQAVITTQANAFDNLMASFGDKENSDSIAPQRPNDLDLDQAHSLLNPDAKEFIPSFGSNPASPTSPFATGMPQNEPVLSEVKETEMYFGQAPSIVPRHILNDDIITGSPRKGKVDNNMDAVSLPKELAEFEQEADQRPHELEPIGIEVCHQRDEVMTPDQAIQQLPLDDIVTQDKENHPPSDSIDFQHSNFMDHGPETSVDLEIDLDLQTSDVLSSIENKEDDVMKRSMYVANDDAIEDLLNSVQPIPTDIDSLNNSFIEESATESAANQLAVEKELLQVEEKEHVSHSPSTEEIQMNLQNTLNSSNKDIPQLPIDVDNAVNMEDSLYVEQQQQDLKQNDDVKTEELVEENPMPQTQFEELLQDEQQQVIEDETELKNQFDPEHEVSYEPKKKQEKMENFLAEFDPSKQPEEQKTVVEMDKLEEHPLDNNKLHDDHDLTQEPMSSIVPTQEAEKNLFADPTHPLNSNESFLDNTLEIQEHRQETNESFSPFKINDELSNTPAVESFNDDVLENHDDDMTPSFTADEKHLLEETKEQQLFSISGLEKQMGELILNKTDDNLLQAEEIATAIAIDAIEDASENTAKPGQDSVLLAKAEEIATAIAIDALGDVSEERPQEEFFMEDSFTKHEQEQPLEQMFVEDSFTKHEQEQTQEQLVVDDSFTKHEQECLEQYQKELQHEQEMDIEDETKRDSVNDYIESAIAEPIESRTAEPIESRIQQQYELELESEMAAVQEPIVESKKAAPLFTNEDKTEIVDETKIEEIQELPPCMVPETAPAESLEPLMETRNETENISYQEEQPQQATEEVEVKIIKEPEVEEIKEKEELEPIKEEVVPTPEISAEIPVEADVVVAAAAIAAATAAVATKIAETEKKPVSKTTGLELAKPKVASTTTTAKKPTEVVKKLTAAVAKPRSVAAKLTPPTTEKKPIAKTTSASTTTAARKPLTATTTATSKIVAKSTSTTATTRTVTAASKTTTTSRPTTTARTVTSSTGAARKPASASGLLAKQRPSTAPAKPTTLGLPATNDAPKSKTLSPRTTATLQVRKPAPATTAAKSPIKPTPTNGVTKTTSSTLASRTKTTTTSLSSTAGTAKTFTARPAPKFNSSSSATTTTTTARRLAVGSSTMSSTTTTTTKTSSAGLRKSTPTKPALGKTHTPTKATATPIGLKQKTPITKTASPPEKPSPIRKPINKIITVTNGEANANKELNGTAEEQYLQSSTQNGDLQAVKVEQQNGDSSIPMQTDNQEPPFLGPTGEQTTMDLINA